MDPKDRKPILSMSEKERRWSLVRERMTSEGLDAIIIWGSSLIPNETACRYLTNFAIFGSSQDILLFMVDKDPILLLSSPQQIDFAKITSWIPSQNIHFAENIGVALSKHLSALGLQNKRIGIDNPGAWPMRYYQALRDLCPEIELVEVTRWYSEIRASNSPEELELIANSIRIGELAQKTFLANLKSGMTEEELVGKVDEITRANGVENKVWLIASTPVSYPYWPGETVIRKPNMVSFSTEFNTIRGYACQVIRTYCWEEPKGEEKRACDLWEELRQMAIAEFRPGHELTEMGAKMVKTINDWGFECDYLGHGVGLTFFIQPNMSNVYPTETAWTILPNQVIVIHPMIRPKGGGTLMPWVGDMFLAKEDGTEWMTSFLPRIPEMIP